MHKKFEHKEIEQKWQERWKESNIYDVKDRDSSKEKEYVLVEWPYPSGNLHIGHWFAFAVVDIYVRAHRMQGKQVLFPMGFDAFGLPAENAAIKRNLNPREWTESNIEYMREQLASMGNAFTWNKTCSSTDPSYYKWTQWMFAQFFENGIAYRGAGIVNWCPSCNTVLANEQVLSDDTCERCGSNVEKKEMEEWKFRITKYADRLLDDLEKLDWPEPIKEAQRNWIGKSEGVEIIFKLSTGNDLTVFTTRPDTLFGATYMVVAPEHKLIEELLNKQDQESGIKNKDEVVRYIELSKQKTEIERTNAEKEKTGVQLEGVTATNPANGEEIPVFVADYVLVGYGTGAIMAVPAHDERDYAFAKKHSISIKPVVMPTYVGRCVREWMVNNKVSIESETKVPDLIKLQLTNHETFYVGKGQLINSEEFNGLNSDETKEAITKKVGGKISNSYKLRDWSVGRQRYWGVPIPIVYDPEGIPHAIPKKHLPWLLPEDVDPKPTGEPPLAKSKELKERTEKIFGKGWTPEVDTMDTFLDSSWYFLRYLDNQNDDEFASKKAQENWMPIDIYFGGAEHTTLHLLYSRFWQKALFDLGHTTVDEPYTKRINRGLVLGPDGNKMSKSKGNVIDPDEQVKRLGADTVKMYLAFMGPYGEVTNYPWNMGGIVGIRRFLERVNGLSEHVIDTEPEEVTHMLHKTVKKVTEDIENYKFNTAISALMILVNNIEKYRCDKETYSTLLCMMAAFAPHLAEELWEKNGHTTFVHREPWPEPDKTFLTEDAATIAVQFDGKTRGTVDVAPDAQESDVIEVVKDTLALNRRLERAEIQKVIYVPGKIINFILS